MLESLVSKMVNAKIIIYGKKKETVECMFNPSQFTVKQTAQYTSYKAVQSEKEGEPQYLNTENGVLSLTLFFDTSSDGNLLEVIKDSVMKDIHILEKALKLSGPHHMPPKTEFVWGETQFKGVVKSLSYTVTMFDMLGKPTRAKVDLTIEKADAGSGLALGEAKESPDRTKCRIMTEGMSLWNLAYEEYGDCEQWKRIAKANGLMNPFDLKPGQTIKIPSL